MNANTDRPGIGHRFGGTYPPAVGRDRFTPACVARLTCTGPALHCCQFAPTHVGRSSQHTRPHDVRPVHPHTRGDIGVVIAGRAHGPGSPPHAWGHCRECDGPGRLQRFTPTRVGTFICNAPGSSSGAVHPHTRGDIGPVCKQRVRLAGSPPHAWGHCLDESRSRSNVRFTPTRVGTLPLPLPPDIL